MSWTLGILFAIGGTSVVAGCLGELKVTPPDGGGAGGAGTGGEGAAGGNGAGGNAMACVPSTMSDCDTGLLGICAAGKATCSADGSSMGPCQAVNTGFDDCTTSADEDCDGTPITQCTGNVEWTYTAPGANNAPNDDALFGISAASDGKFAITGTVNGTVAAGPAVNAGKFYLAKVDATGALTWEKTFPGTDVASGRGIAVDSAGNIIVVGDFSGGITFDAKTLTSVGAKDIVVAKFNSTGDLIWANQIGGDNTDIGIGVAVDANGNIYATGRLTSSSIDLGAGASMLNSDDAFVVSYASDGSFRWGRVFVNPGAQSGRAITVSPEGDVVIIGESSGNTSFGGTNHPNGGATDAFIAKFRGTNGDFIWSKMNSNAGTQAGRGVAPLPNGNFVFVGVFENQIDFGAGALAAASSVDSFVVEFAGTTGTPMRQVRGGLTGSTFAHGVAVDGAGHVVIHGIFAGRTEWGSKSTSAATAQDVFTVKLDAKSWEALWLQVFSGSGDQTGSSVAIHSQGSIMTAGYFDTELNLGSGMPKINSSGGLDRYMVRLAP